jgi:anti-sigma B factor antagonist
VPHGGDPVEWVGRQAVVRLPDHIDLFTADLLGEELLALAGRGAAALIVDMTATASCDPAAAEALVHACRGAVASGTQLRLVAPSEVIRRALRLDGLHRLVPVHPSREAAIAAGLPAAQPSAAGSPQVSQDLLGGIVCNLFQAGLSLQAALDAAHEADRQYIMQALHYLDQTIRDIRDQVFATGRQPNPPPSEPPDCAQ